MESSEQVAALEALYAELPTLDCKRECAKYCTATWMSRVEWDRILKRVKNPRATKYECPMLRKGQCTVHAVRPMMCRLWGLSEAHLCEWGCRPSRVLTASEAQEFMRRSWELGA